MKKSDNIKDNCTAEVFGSHSMREPAPAEQIPQHKTPAVIAYQIVKDEIDIITIHIGFMTQQCDSADEIFDFFLDKEVKDYDIEYDSDEGIVYLDIYCE